MACKAVMVATGGFANNKEWIKKYCGLELGVDVIPIGNTGKVGDGIRMAWEAGAAEEGIEAGDLPGGSDGLRSSPGFSAREAPRRSPISG